MPGNLHRDRLRNASGEHVTASRPSKMMEQPTVHIRFLTGRSPCLAKIFDWLALIMEHIVASENSICLQHQQDAIRLCHIVTWTDPGLGGVFADQGNLAASSRCTVPFTRNKQITRQFVALNRRCSPKPRQNLPVGHCPVRRRCHHHIRSDGR